MRKGLGRVEISKSEKVRRGSARTGGKLNPASSSRIRPTLLTLTLSLYCADIRPTWLFATNSRRVNELTQDRAEALRHLNLANTVSDEAF
jgi:hypothetical protein